jgi:chromosome segregation ATPase
MSMRLMPKSEVAKAKANAQKREIDEGAKLAKRVDGLRETAAKEEAALTKFRIEQVEAMHAEIRPLAAERDALTGEVADLRTQRKALLVPLDKEWANVAKAKQQIAQDIENARALTAAAQETDRQVKLATKQAADTLARVATKEDAVRERLRKAAEHEKEAKRASLSAQKAEAKALKLAAEVEKDLRARDNAVALRESSVTIKEANLIEGEAELAKGWILLNDRKAAFEKRITNTST